MWHLGLMNIGDQLMLLVLPFTLHSLSICFTILQIMNSKSPSPFLLAMESVFSGLLDKKYTLGSFFFHIEKVKKLKSFSVLHISSIVDEQCLRFGTFNSCFKNCNKSD